MTNQPKNETFASGFVPMWGVPKQPSCHAGVNVSQTMLGSAQVESLLRDLCPKVLFTDLGSTVRIDRGLLGELEPVGLLQRAATILHAQAELRLPGDFTEETVIRQTELLKLMAAGQKPQLTEEISRAASGVCQEAFQAVRKIFDAAAADAPAKLDANLDDQLKALDGLALPPSSQGRAMGQLEKRAEQLASSSRLREELKDQAYKALQRRLLQAAQLEYAAAVDELTAACFRECWNRQRTALKERCEQHLEESRAYRIRVRLCMEDYEEAFQRAKQKLTNLQAGNQVILGEADAEQLMADIMAHRKAGGQSELLEGLRHELENRLRDKASPGGAAQGSQTSFRRLVLALPVHDVVETLRTLVLESISGSNSFYEICQAYGLERLVVELAKRSRITSYFDGRDDSRHGLTRFVFNIVRMPAASNPTDVEIKELMETLFRQHGFDHIVSNGHDRSISVMQIYAGWPIGIEGGNAVLLESYGRSQRTGHLPHLVGILPDTSAGEHAPGILKLLGEAGPKE